MDEDKNGHIDFEECLTYFNEHWYGGLALFTAQEFDAIMVTFHAVAVKSQQVMASGTSTQQLDHMQAQHLQVKRAAERQGC